MILDRIHALKHKLGPLWWHSLLMFGVCRIGDVVNIYISVFLVPDLVDPDRLGIVLPLTQLAVFVGFPLSIFLETILKFLNVLHIHGKPGQVKKLLHDLVWAAAFVSVLIAVVLWFGRGFVQERLKYESAIIIWLVIGVSIIGCWQNVVITAARALKRFNWLIGQGLFSSGIRVILMLLLLSRFQVSGYLIATGASYLVVVLTVGYAIRHHVHPGIGTSSYREHLHRIAGYFIPIGLFFIMNNFQLVYEPWVVRHRLSPMDSAGFYMVMMFGSVPGFMATAVMPFLFTLVSERHERGESTTSLHSQALVFTLLLAGTSAIVMGLAGRPLLGLRSTWRTYLDYAPFVWQLGLATALRSVITLHAVHEAACRRFGFLRYYVPIIALEFILLQSLMGWAFFKPWLPAGPWEFVENLVTRDLQFIVGFMLGTRGLMLLCVMAEAVGQWRGRRHA